MASTPSLAGNTCRFLGANFDGPTAILEALAYSKAARALDVPAAVPAAPARSIGTALIHEAMVLRGSTDLRSCYRLFPSQDGLTLFLDLVARTTVGDEIRTMSRSRAWVRL